MKQPDFLGSQAAMVMAVLISTPPIAMDPKLDSATRAWAACRAISCSIHFAPGSFQIRSFFEN
jgi:hypothetical protein